MPGFNITPFKLLVAKHMIGIRGMDKILDECKSLTYTLVGDVDATHWLLCVVRKFLICCHLISVLFK
jgi:hypothetical protein